MVIRHIREHAARHNWFVVGIDLAIVVVGVFLGTQANNWNEGRIERAKGHSYRQRLMADLQANKSDYAARQRYATTIRAHALAALEAFDRQPGAGDGQFLIDLYQASRVNPRRTQRSTYDEIVSVAALETVGDEALRRSLMNFYTGVATTSVAFDNVPPYREHLRSAMPYPVQQNVVARCPEAVKFKANGDVELTEAQSCSLDLPADQVAAAAAKLRREPKLSDELTRLAVDHDLKINLFALEYMETERNRLLLLAVDRAG